MLAWKNESSVPTSRQYPFSRSSWPGTTFCEKSYTLATPDIGQRRDHVAAQVGVLVLARRHDVDQRLRVEHVVAHARQAAGVVARHRRRRRGLLVEGDDVALVVRLDHTEVDRLVLRHRDRGHGHAGPDVEMFGDHLTRVHPVDVVGAEHAHDVRPLVVDEVQVLIDGVRRPLEPVRPAAHLGGHRRHVVVEHRREPPGLGDVAVEAVALVLREHDDLAGSPALAKFDSAKSINRYVPANGTAGLARSFVSGCRRFPSPPARTMTSTDGSAADIATQGTTADQADVGRRP